MSEVCVWDGDDFVDDELRLGAATSILRSSKITNLVVKFLSVDNKVPS